MSDRSQTLLGALLGVAFAAGVLAFYLFVLGGAGQVSGTGSIVLRFTLA